MCPPDTSNIAWGKTAFVGATLAPYHWVCPTTFKVDNDIGFSLDAELDLVAGTHAGGERARVHRKRHLHGRHQPLDGLMIYR